VILTILTVTIPVLDDVEVFASTVTVIVPLPAPLTGFNFIQFTLEEADQREDVSQTTLILKDPPAEVVSLILVGDTVGVAANESFATDKHKTSVMKTINIVENRFSFFINIFSFLRVQFAMRNA
jgi:hypothetical protein